MWRWRTLAAINPVIIVGLACLVLSGCDGCESGPGGFDADLDGSIDGDADVDGDIEDPTNLSLTFPGLHLNELSVRPTIPHLHDPAEPGAMEWIEIFNGGSESVSLEGLGLLAASRVEEDGILFVLPDLEMPPVTHLVVVFLQYDEESDASGDGSTTDEFLLLDDLDFSDGEALLFVEYEGSGEEGDDGLLGDDGDDIALVTEGGLGETVAFVAYGEPFEEGASDLEHDAVTAGLWSGSGRVDITELGFDDSFGLLVDGFHASAGERDHGSGESLADMAGPEDYRRYPWVSDPPQPSNSLNISPIDGTIHTDVLVTLTWSECPGGRYLLEVADGPDFDAPSTTVDSMVLEETSYELDHEDFMTSRVYWRVACLFDEETRTGFTEPWLFLTDDSEGDQKDAATLGGLTHEWARKDTGMLCMYHFNLGNRYGCPESITIGGREYRWNKAHVVNGNELYKDHDYIGKYRSAQAAIQMVHRYYATKTGSSAALSQDFISFHMFREKNPRGDRGATDPEGDLGIGEPVGARDLTKFLAEALRVRGAVGSFTQRSNWNKVQDWIRQGRPVIVRYRSSKRSHNYAGTHWAVIKGFRTTPRNEVLILDPLIGERWVSSSRVSSGTAIVPPAVSDIGGLMEDEAGLSTDQDGDGICDFDEFWRGLHSEYDNTDTDGDQVSDYNEVRSYTFSNENDPSARRRAIIDRDPDVDGDRTRAEGDCDTDDDGDHDGGENINDNHTTDEGETDPFVARNHAIELSFSRATKQYLIGEDVEISGGSLHADTDYPILVQAAKMNRGDRFADAKIRTNGSGMLTNVKVHTCREVGERFLHIDIAKDHTFNLLGSDDEEASDCTDCDRVLSFSCIRLHGCLIPDPRDDGRNVLTGLPEEIEDYNDLISMDIRDRDRLTIELQLDAPFTLDSRSTLYLEFSSEIGSAGRADWPASMRDLYVGLVIEVHTGTVRWYLFDPGRFGAGGDAGTEVTPPRDDLFGFHLTGDDTAIYLHNPDTRFHLSHDGELITIDFADLTGVRVRTEQEGYEGAITDSIPNLDTSGVDPLWTFVPLRGECPE